MPLSELGHCTGRNDLAIAMKVYFDYSEGNDKSQDQWMTLAAAASTDRDWNGFNKQWRAMLSNRYPIAPYMHMNQIFSNEDPFEAVLIV